MVLPAAMLFLVVRKELPPLRMGAAARFLGLLLFIAGLTATEDRWWARVLWLLLSIAVVAEAVVRIRKRKRDTISEMSNER